MSIYRAVQPADCKEICTIDNRYRLFELKEMDASDFEITFWQRKILLSMYFIYHGGN